LSDLVERLGDVVGPGFVLTGERVQADYTHDESLTGRPVVPLAVVRPGTTGEVAQLLALATEARVPVVARGSGTGLSGGARPAADGLVIAFDRMDRILEIDADNHVAVVQPGVTLDQLDATLAPIGLVYPVFPGEPSASLGGNVATNAGGMRAIRYGVTRHHVLGLEAVLADGRVIRTGGRYVKSATGYDLTQLLVGSEGTLALVTEVTLKLEPRLPHTATLLVPFATLELVADAVPRVVASGAAPLILEYLDVMAMAGITAAAGLDLGVPEEVRSGTLAYLVVVLESTHADRLEEDTEAIANLLGELGALDVYVLPPTAGAQLIAAREKAFFVSKAAGADDIVDTVVPRAAIPAFLSTAARLADDHGSLLSGCGHVGDGNVHLSVFQPDPDRRAALLRALFAAAAEVGGAISGEHGIGIDKQGYFLELEDPVKVDLMRQIKAAFDPHGILGPGRLLGPSPLGPGPLGPDQAPPGHPALVGGSSSARRGQDGP
jgi:glycolate oxidase